jgi:hypothetical protein
MASIRYLVLRSQINFEQEEIAMQWKFCRSKDYHSKIYCEHVNGGMATEDRFNAGRPFSRRQCLE